VLRICHELVRLGGELSAVATRGANEPFNEALRRAANVARHDHLVVLVTDYAGDDETTRALATKLAAHNDVLAVLVYDPAGIRLPASGFMEATDGRQRVAIPAGRAFADAFESEFRQRCDQLRGRLRALRIPILPICTHDPVPDQVLAALGGRPRA